MNLNFRGKHMKAYRERKSKRERERKRERGRERHTHTLRGVSQQFSSSRKCNSTLS